MRSGVVIYPAFSLFQQTIRNKRLLFNLGLYKLAFFGFTLLLIQIIPAFSAADFRQNFHYPPDREPAYADHFRSWDGHHYLFLAEHGYQRGGFASNAFYPLWPALISAASALAPGFALPVSLLLAGFFSVLGVALFHTFTSRYHGKAAAATATVCLLAYPGALFLNFPYSEALFLFLLMVLFAFLFEERYWTAGAVSVLLVLTRPIGIFTFVLLAAAPFIRKSDPRKSLAAVLPLAGLAIYLLWMWHATGNAWEGFDMQGRWVQRASILKVLDIPGFLGRLLDVVPVHTFRQSPVDRAFFVLAVLLTVRLWWVDKRLWLWAVLAGIVPAMTSDFMSYTRYATLALPLFIGAALWLEKRSPSWTRLSVGFLAALQVFLLFRHVNNYWAG